MTTAPSTLSADTVRIARPVTTPQRVVDAARLWTGGLATAVVAALIGLVGVLVLRAAAQVVPHVLAGNGPDVLVLCTAAALGALAATGLAHLLVLSTPRPLAYLGWIVGLATAAAAVLPLATGAPLVAGLAAGVIHLVVGMAIASLMVSTASSATRGTCEI